MPTPTVPARAHGIRATRSGARRLVGGVLALLLATACGWPPGGSDLDSAAPLVGAVPPEVDRPVAWQQDGGDRLAVASLVGLAAEGVRGVVASAPPTVWLVAHPDASSADPGGAGYQPLAELPGWTLWERGEVSEQTVGLPALGVGPGVIVAGSAEEVRAVAERVGGRLGDEVEDGQPVHLPVEGLAQARRAVVGPPSGSATGGGGGAAGTLRAHDGIALTWITEDRGQLTISRPGSDQDDAVQLAVRLRNGVLGGAQAASALLVLEGPLAVERGVDSPVRWLADPADVLRAALADDIAELLEP